MPSVHQPTLETLMAEFGPKAAEAVGSKPLTTTAYMAAVGMLSPMFIDLTNGSESICLVDSAPLPAPSRQ
jgi:hypothetical protein